MLVELTLIDGDRRQDYQWQADRNLARDMLAFIRDKLAEHAMTFNDITGIGVFRGPGSYTGLRIGMAVLNTIASDQSVPIVGSAVQDWQTECITRLESNENDAIILPEYGGDAHITKPRK